jgi:hypothetical protein
MPATRSTIRKQGRRKKPGLISGAATKVAALATKVGSRIGASVREPAAQIASFVSETAQHLPVIGHAKNGSASKRAAAKAKSAGKAKRRARSRTRRPARA